MPWALEAQALRLAEAALALHMVEGLTQQAWMALALLQHLEALTSGNQTVTVAPEGDASRENLQSLLTSAHQKV